MGKRVVLTSQQMFFGSPKTVLIVVYGYFLFSVHARFYVRVYACMCMCLYVEARKQLLHVIPY